MICHETYKDENGKWLSPDEVIEMGSVRAIIEILTERGAITTEGSDTERASTAESEGRQGL